MMGKIAHLTIVFNDTFRINLELIRVRDLAHSYR